MYDYKKYDRAFIVLSPETSGYSAEGQKLSGTVILEIRDGKGRATVTVQGLKPSAAAVFKIYLISSKDTGATGVPLGAFMPNEKGKARGVWDFDPVSVCNSGIEYADFNVVAVMLKSGGASNEIIAPLVGYKSTSVIWKSGYKEFSPVSAVPKAAETTEKELQENEITEELLKPEVSELSGYEAGVTSEEQAGRPAVCKAEAAFARLSKRLEAVESLSMAEDLYAKIKGFAPEESVASFINLIATMVEYVPTENVEALTLLLEEGAGLAHDIHLEEREPLSELLTTVGEYIPGKVKESVVDVFGDMLKWIPADESPRLYGVLKCCADFYNLEQAHSTVKEELQYFTIDDKDWEAELPFVEAPEETVVDNNAADVQTIADSSSALATEAAKADGDTSEHITSEKVEAAEDIAAEASDGTEAAPEPIETKKIKLKSGVEGEYTLREPSPGENHGERYMNALREFNRFFDNLEGKSDSDDEPPQSLTDETAASVPDDSRKQSPHKSGKKFKEEELYKLFEKNKRTEPFRLPPGAPGAPGVPGAPGGFKPHDKRPPIVQPGFPPAVPPTIPIYDIRWVQITQKDVYLLPEKLWIYATNPFVSHAYRKYGHLLLGVSGHHGSRAYYLGVPGAYSERERMRALALGFTTFMPVNGGIPKRGEFGYWILKAY